MRWCRIRLVLLGLLLCVVHVVSGTCGQNFTDPKSTASLSDVVIEGKVRKLLTPAADGTFSVQVAIRKHIFKGKKRINRNRPAKKLTVEKFHLAPEDPRKCIGSVEKGRTYFFFLKDIGDPKGLHFANLVLPVIRSRKVARTMMKVLCEDCPRSPKINKLLGPTQLVPRGSKIVLRCFARGNPKPAVTWYKDGKRIQDQKGIRIKNGTRQSRLLIKDAKEHSGGSYECRATNAVGEAKKVLKVAVDTRGFHECIAQTYCLNGGTCWMHENMDLTFCRCPEQWAGRRCELLDAISVSGDYNRQATLMYERTLIIIGIVIAVLVFIVICIASYVLAKHKRKRFEERQKRREIKRQLENRRMEDAVDNRNNPQSVVLGKESFNRVGSAPLGSKQIGHIILQDPPAPPRLSRGHLDGIPHQQPHHGPSDPKLENQPQLRTESNGNKPESRRRLVASSVYENTDGSKPLPFAEYVDAPKNQTTAAVHPENIEMKALGNNGTGNQKSPDSAHQLGSPNADDNVGTNSVELPLPPSTPSAPTLPPEPLSSSPPHHLNGILPPPSSFSVLAPSSQSSSPSSSFPSPHRYQDDASSRDDDDTAAQPLLPKHEKHFPITRYDHPSQTRPFESKSDKDLTRHFQSGSKRQEPCDIPGQTDPCSERERLLKNPKVPHSNTFPKSNKVNGMPSENYLDSDDEDLALEIPYEKHLDLHISEDDLDLSKENLVSSSFNSVVTPSRQASREEPVIGLLPNASLSRPKIRKYLSEEVPASNILASKTQGLHLQDYLRSRSLDDPPSVAEEDTQPHSSRLNSTLAGSPEVETYDNLVPRPSDFYNHDNAFDPNEDVTPWDGEGSRPVPFENLTEEELDKLNRLKDVLPDQPAIPI